MPKSLKRSKSNGLKSRKRPGKKSGNAKKMRRTRKNKGGITLKQGSCTGFKFVGTVTFGAIILFLMSQGADFGSGSGSGMEVPSIGSTTEESFLDCDSLAKKVYKSLKEINLAKKIIAGDGIWNFTYKYEIIKDADIQVIVIEQGILGRKRIYETTEKYDIVYIKKNTGMLVNKDEYYLFRKDGTLDVFRSIAFTHINRYISKKGYSRKYHLLSLLKSDNADDAYNNQIKKLDGLISDIQKKVEPKITEITTKMKAEIQKLGRELYPYEKSNFDKKLKIEEEKYKKFEKVKKDLNENKEIFIKFWTAFRSAAIYLCNRHTAEGAKYDSRSNLKNVCQNENTSKPDYDEFKNSIEELITLPMMEYNRFTENRVYPEDVEWNTEQKLNQVI